VIVLAGNTEQFAKPIECAEALEFPFFKRGVFQVKGGIFNHMNVTAGTGRDSPEQVSRNHYIR